MTSPRSILRSGGRWIAGALVLAVLLMLVVANFPQGRPWLVDRLGIQPGQDKIGHFWLMGALAAALVVVTRGAQVRGRTIPTLGVLLATVVLVSFDEALQAVIPGRAATWSDFYASMAGIGVLGVGAWLGCIAVERMTSSQTST